MERQVILFPENTGPGDFQITVLPVPNDPSVKKPYLRHQTTHELFELKNLDGSGVYEPATRKKLKLGASIASWIVECDHPYVLQQGSMLVATKFLPIYHVILLMYQEKAHKFTPEEDIMERLNLGPIAVDLGTVCETTDVDDDKYYKFLLEKTTAYLWDKIHRLAAYFKEHPDQQLLYFLDQKFSDPQLQTPAEVLELARLMYAYELVLNLYCVAEFKKEMTYDFLPVLNHLEKVAETQRGREIAEKNIASIAESNANAKTNGKRKAPVKKAPVKKVAKGRGALDSFFKAA